MYNVSNTKGAVALSLVLIIGSAVLILTLGVHFMNLGTIDMVTKQQESREVKHYADGCVYEAMYGLKENAAYGGDVLSDGSLSCIIGIQTQGQDRIVMVTTTDGIFMTRSQVFVTLGTPLEITSWITH